MPDHMTPPQPELSFNLELIDQLAGSWERYSQHRRGVRLTSASAPHPTGWQQAQRSLGLFIIGFLLGVVHLTFASLAVCTAANALGYLPPVSLDEQRLFSAGSLAAGVIWFWLLAGASIQKFRYQLACRKRWRIDFPEIFEGPVPVSIRFLAESVNYEILGNRNTVPIGKSLGLVNTTNYLLLFVRSGVISLSKKKLSPVTLDAILRWSADKNALLLAVAKRSRYLPPRLSASLGATLLLVCLWAGTHVKLIPRVPIYPTSVTLSLPNEITIVAGQVVNLQRLSYEVSDYQGTLYDQLKGYVYRPEISGTFFVDRSATPFLAQTAEAEFKQERSWHLTIGQIPDTATMEPLPDSSVFIAWDQPHAANYPGHCGALRSNSDTSPVVGGRVLWRRRLYLQLCSAAMSKTELRDWMLQAIPPMSRVIAYHTHTKP
jgi:hypothetical protein